MKILVFNTAASETGALNILQRFYDYVCENDIRNTWTFVVSAEGLSKSANVMIIQNSKVKKNWLRRIKFEIFETRKIIKNENPDIILSLQNLALLWTKVPQIIYFHQSLPYNGFKKYSFFKKNERFIAVYLFILKFLFSYSFKKAEKIVVQTEWLKRAIIDKNHISGEKIMVIPPGISLKVKSGRKNAFNSCNKFFYPTNAFEHKNIIRLVNAFKRLLEIKSDVCLYITIDGVENSYAREIIKIIYGYENKIILTGRLSSEKLLEFYSECALIFPSYVESFGLPLLEARASGCDIICSDLPFSREILLGYNNLWFFDPFDTSSILNALDSYISQKSELKNDFNHNEDAYLNKFLPINTWGKIIEILEKNGI